MDRTPVSSSDLASVGYEATSMLLEIEFLSGSIYQYFDVPESEFQQLMQAASHGSYFSANIRNRYRYIRL